MKRWLRSLLLALGLGLPAAVALYGTWPRQTREAVTVVAVQPGSIEQVVSATGSVEARRKVLVTAEPGARIAALYFDEHDLVAKGQVLAKLDDLELATQLRQLETSLQVVKANLADAETALAQTKALYGKGYVARQEVEAGQRQVELYRAQLAEKQAAMHLLKAKLERTRIRAPIAGAITRKLVEVGGVVSDGARGGAGGAAGQLQPIAIAEIAHLEALEFHVDVDQTEIGLIKRGQKAVIELDAFPDRRLQGTVQDITLASVEEISGRVRYKVRVALEKTDLPLRLGMTGAVNFVLARKEQVLTLPTAVLVQRGGEDFVFVVEHGLARQRALHIGLRNEERVEVVAGLQAGDEVIDQGRNKVKDGQPVDVLNGRR